MVVLGGEYPNCVGPVDLIPGQLHFIGNRELDILIDERHRCGLQIVDLCPLSYESLSDLRHLTVERTFAGRTDDEQNPHHTIRIRYLSWHRCLCPWGA